MIRRKRNSAKKFLKRDTIDLLANHLQYCNCSSGFGMLSHKAVHLIQGINEQKVHSIFCSSNALWIPCHNKEVMLHFYSANLMRDASLNDRVELRILGDVGAKILVINFDTPGVQFRERRRENESGGGRRDGACWSSTF